MNTPILKKPRVTVAPTLSEGELAAADAIGRRLQSELRDVLALLPEEHRAASALSRLLQLDRATCQRIVQATGHHEAGPRTLITLPGVEGLRSFLAAVGGKVQPGVGRETLGGAQAAIDRFDLFLDDLGMSQRGLRAVLEGPEGREPSLHPPADDAAAREALFRAAADVVGRWSAASLHVSIIRPVPGDPTLTDWARVRGLITHQWRDHTVPLELGGTATLRSPGHGPAMGTLEPQPASGPLSTALLAEFCSQPLPPVVSKAAGKRVVQVIDTGAFGGHGPADIVTASRVSRPDPHPATMSPPVGEVWAIQNIPARRLVFDTFLHRDIAECCRASVEGHLWMPDVGTRHDAARWSTRLPGGPRLERLEMGSMRTTAYPRYDELMAHVFDELGWPADEYVGYRCEIEYPVWRAGYVMLFDFAEATGEM